MTIAIEMRGDMAVFRHAPGYAGVVDEFDGLPDRRKAGGLCRLREIGQSAIDRLADELDSPRRNPDARRESNCLALRIRLERMRQLGGIAMSLDTLTRFSGEQASMRK